MPIVGIVLFVAGLFLVVAGLFRAPWSDDVTCGSRTMKPGDTCMFSKGGSQSYEEREQVRDNGAWMLGGGVAGMVVGPVLMVAGKRRT